MKNNDDGFTLIETIISITLISFVVAVLTGVAVNTSQQNTNNETRDVMLSIANSELERSNSMKWEALGLESGSTGGRDANEACQDAEYKILQTENSYITGKPVTMNEIVEDNVKARAAQVGAVDGNIPLRFTPIEVGSEIDTQGVIPNSRAKKIFENPVQTSRPVLCSWVNWVKPPIDGSTESQMHGLKSITTAVSWVDRGRRQVVAVSTVRSPIVSEAQAPSLENTDR